MGNIVLLDDLTINQIAAGEVVERPVNVVKELVENSIDAGAKEIIVEIKNGGKTYIKVSDNGKGISKDDMDIAFERHATSKIRNIDDVEKISSMGFRGEALASIASISKTTMVSKTEKEDTGYKIVNIAGNIEEMEEVVVQRGTTILVEELFFNTPVRYKFLKQDSTEFRYIKEWMQKVSLANPDISFRLLNSGKIILKTSGNGRLEDVIYTIYGKQIKDNLVQVNYDANNVKITGVIGNTLIAKENRKDQIFFLNKRYIKNNIISNSADQAFKGGTGINKFGFFILNIEMNPNMYDINVHPTKLEVRFKNEDSIYKAVYYAIKSSLLKSQFLGNKENENEEKYVENEYKFLTNHFVESNNLEEKSDEKEITEEVKKEENKDENHELIKRKAKRKIEYNYVGILFRTYIIIEIDNEVYFIDQHAAHERILYEEIKENYKNNIKNNTQMMLIPEVLNLSHKEIEFIKKYIQMFRNIGFDIEPFGDLSIKINGIPDLDYKTNSKHIFLDILDEMMTNERGQIRDIEERFIATVACKAAVKAHMDLSKEEVDYLIQNLLNLNNPYTCPHGRPTTIKYTREDLEKLKK